MPGTGLFAHQLKAWRDAFCTAPASDSSESKTALRELQAKHEVLQRDLRRKERALADESPRILRRLKSLRGLSHEEVKQVFPGSTRTRSAHGAGAPKRLPLAVGGN
jgi:hypothetical protein